MKIRVIVPFTDKMFNDEITRNVDDIIDTEKVIVINEEDIPKVEGVIFNKEITPKAIIKPVKKGKKASKKK